jgi:hypothetical protein
LRGARRKYVNLRRKKQEKNLEIFSILEWFREVTDVTTLTPHVQGIY